MTDHIHSNACDDHDAARRKYDDHRLHCSCFTELEHLRVELESVRRVSRRRALKIEDLQDELALERL